ncbi:rhodanese-like domain-containing protein [Demequina sp. NBRC 110051]|uniref:rhodanese-like domain-containing protein n=1 Tax=Demequina sp. NBRC 110051 TaxID=1570340 RepID=UPI00190E6741|nr:rhodanese-like domain-containing protein [Demequina sp. NBRC 110051]
MAATLSPVRSWALALTAAVALAGCSAPAESIELTEDSVVVDVRTPAEYAGGHLDGAVNLDLQSATFAADVAALDEDAEYVVYCQSGNRSGQATPVFEDAGLTVVDAGGIADAAESTGLDVVK